jgi:FADH2 O2-dependent halogenase
MAEKQFDVAIVGAAFGGSLTAVLLQRSGLRVLLLDRGSHPRFAIGESSTPIANAVLADLARKYDLPRLLPLAKYGAWQRTYPHLTCGLKRGFSYFLHRPGEPFLCQPDHANELLVAASSRDAIADTHWLRADVDQFLAEEAAREGAEYVDRCESELEPRSKGWRISAARLGGAVRADFLVDASGEAGALARMLKIPNDVARLKTNSRALFCHVAGLRKWQEFLAAHGADLTDHPFPCDAAAVHHFLAEGWMWQLRFNNDITSVGFTLDAAAQAPDVSPADEWAMLLDRYPSLRVQFATTTLVQPPDGLRRTGRLQRCAAQAVGRTWAMLPNTAGFIDPLHSTGIAHSLCGIERLVGIFQRDVKSAAGFEALQEHARLQREEIGLIDLLVSGCYLARQDFRLLVPFSSLYFAAATSYEHRRHEGAMRAGAGYLLADDPAFRRLVESAWNQVRKLSERPAVSDAMAKEFESELAAAIRPYNRVGLLAPAVNNMYPHTAAPVDE